MLEEREREGERDSRVNERKQDVVPPSSRLLNWINVHNCVHLRDSRDQKRHRCLETSLNR